MGVFLTYVLNQKVGQLQAQNEMQQAYYLLVKASVPADMTHGQKVNNGKIDVPAVLLTPVAATSSNVKDTVVKDGFWTVQQICTSTYAAACKAAGLG